jgi:hypothetical protein
MSVNVRSNRWVLVGLMGVMGCTGTIDESDETPKPGDEFFADSENVGPQGTSADVSAPLGTGAIAKGTVPASADASVPVVDTSALVVADASAPTADAGAPRAIADASAPPVVAAANTPSAICAVPAGAGLEDASRPTTVVGTGTPASCSSAAFVAAVAKGGVITFDCGPAPVTITLTETAKVFNDKAQRIVIDGGNKVTLSGGGKVRILYQNTCDARQTWTTSHCDNQEFPQLTVQNLTFADGNAKGSGEGGGAIFASGGRLKVVNSRFYNNACDDTGPDLGGGAVRALQQYQDQPVFVVGSTFGGDASHANVCSNGGALSSIDVSYSLLNSTLSYNRAIGNGANPANAGTPGGGSGGAIYNDGNTYRLAICGSTIVHNTANEGGGGIFFVSNDRTGSLSIDQSTMNDNPSGKFQNFPGMFVLAASNPSIVLSHVQ